MQRNGKDLQSLLANGTSYRAVDMTGSEKIDFWSHTKSLRRELLAAGGYTGKERALTWELFSEKLKIWIL